MKERYLCRKTGRVRNQTKAYQYVVIRDDTWGMRGANVCQDVSRWGKDVWLLHESTGIIYACFMPVFLKSFSVIYVVNIVLMLY